MVDVHQFLGKSLKKQVNNSQVKLHLCGLQNLLLNAEYTDMVSKYDAHVREQLIVKGIEELRSIYETHVFANQFMKDRRPISDKTEKVSRFRRKNAVFPSALDGSKVSVILARQLSCELTRVLQKKEASKSTTTIALHKETIVECSDIIVRNFVTLTLSCNLHNEDISI